MGSTAEDMTQFVLNDGAGMWDDGAGMWSDAKRAAMGMVQADPRLRGGGGGEGVDVPEVTLLAPRDWLKEADRLESTFHWAGGTDEGLDVVTLRSEPDLRGLKEVIQDVLQRVAVKVSMGLSGNVAGGALRRVGRFGDNEWVSLPMHGSSRLATVSPSTPLRSLGIARSLRLAPQLEEPLPPAPPYPPHRAMRPVLDPLVHDRIVRGAQRLVAQGVLRSACTYSDSHRGEPCPIECAGGTLRSDAGGRRRMDREWRTRG